MRVILDLASDDEKATVKLLKALLKVMGRRFGVRVKGIRAE